MTQQLFPMALVRYAAERGYAGTPTVGAVKFDGHDWDASSFYGEPCTVDVVSQLARAGAEWVCVHWDDAGISGISADFQLSELAPMTGLRACGIDRPIPLNADTSYGDDPTAVYSAPLPWHDADVDPSDWRPEAEHGFCSEVLMVEYAMMHAPDSATADRISDLYSRLADLAL